MSAALRVLIIEDSEFDTQLLLNVLRHGGYDPRYIRVDSAAALQSALLDATWDVIIADYNLPQFSAPAALEIVQKSYLDIPFIIVSGGIGEDMAVAAMRAGANDYVMKGNLARLVPAVERELREAANRLSRRQNKEALRAHQEQFRVARDIQQHLFPKRPPTLAGYDIAGASFPAEATGGDYFDYMPMLYDCMGMVVGDVTGHGIGPALLMAETRAYLRILARNQADAGEVLTMANRVLAEDVGFERFVTGLFVQLNPPNRVLSYANAGHPPGYILDEAGNTKSLLGRSGVPLGLRPGTEYKSSPDIPLVSGDLLLLLTDGFEEAMSPEETFFGIDRVLDTIRKHRQAPADEIVKNLYEVVANFTQGSPQLDDLTVIVMKTL